MKNKKTPQSLFAYDKVDYIENPKYSVKQLL